MRKQTLYRLLPGASARIRRAAELAGMTAAEFVERWALSLTLPDD